MIFKYRNYFSKSNMKINELGSKQFWQWRTKQEELVEFMTYAMVTIVLSTWLWQKNRHITQWNRPQNSGRLTIMPIDWEDTDIWWKQAFSLFYRIFIENKFFHTMHTSPLQFPQPPLLPASPPPPTTSSLFPDPLALHFLYEKEQTSKK